MSKHQSKSREQRFWAKVKKTESCWLWTGAKNNRGYGHVGWVQADGVMRWLYVHRLSYEWARGPIADGHELDHLCQVPACVNPDHLEQVTRAVNASRVGERKTACVRGHDYAEPNVYVGTDGRRQCRACRRDAMRRFYARKAGRDNVA